MPCAGPRGLPLLGPLPGLNAPLAGAFCGLSHGEVLRHGLGDWPQTLSSTGASQRKGLLSSVRQGLLSSARPRGASSVCPRPRGKASLAVGHERFLPGEREARASDDEVPWSPVAAGGAPATLDPAIWPEPLMPIVGPFFFCGEPTPGEPSVPAGTRDPTARTLPPPSPPRPAGFFPAGLSFCSTNSSLSKHSATQSIEHSALGDVLLLGPSRAIWANHSASYEVPPWSTVSQAPRIACPTIAWASGRRSS